MSAADPSLWADLPVLPLIQQSSVFAVTESLRSVLTGPHQGWMWSGPLSGSVRLAGRLIDASANMNVGVVAGVSGRGQSNSRESDPLSHLMTSVPTVSGRSPAIHPNG